MFDSFLIGMREGLAAGVALALLLACLVKEGGRDAVRPVLTGVAAAAVVFLGFGFVLEHGPQPLTFQARRLLAAVLSAVAVCLLTWWILHLRHPARRPAAALVATGFLVVGRVGLETELFVWAAVRAATGSGGGNGAPLVGVLLGIATAVVLAGLIHRGALRLGPAKFLPWTGGMLVVVAAGVLAYGVQDLQDARFLGGAADRAFDIGSAVPPDSWYGALLEGVFAFGPSPTVLQVTVWALYLVPALGLFLAPVGFGRSMGVEEQKATDEKAGSGGDGARGDGGTVPDSERVCDGARRTGGGPVGDER
ncbi:FTR1 family iron permease [Streptomyces peucetius]|uniref:FTR1 family protein n=1 Tax=Streptomyces peucetius TaxID=1950 RepID=A0ABY6I4N1_STRPE|nr:FTR1 family protein [Streptomyces peucetius]UYQ61791.1 FTR1 family protein [Streptomyces peucetius]